MLVYGPRKFLTSYQFQSRIAAALPIPMQVIAVGSLKNAVASALKH